MNKKAKVVCILGALAGLMWFVSPFIVCAGTQEEDELTGACTFYDYVVAPYDTKGWNRDTDRPDQSINAEDNYANDGRQKLTIGTKTQNFKKNRHDCIIGGLNVNTCIFYNGGNPDTKGVTYQQSLASWGIVSHLEGEHYKDVVWNVDTPPLFTDENCVGKTVYTEYKLRFDRQKKENHSTTYTLTDVIKPSGELYDTQAAFFPLDDAPSNTLDKGYGKAHNYYFGMRYDVDFTLNDYMDDLTYTFLGDDDLWVFVDGTLVLDLGGIHASCGATVDLWQTGPIAEEYARVQDREKMNGEQVHTLTVLYMERGGNESNCHMQFTLPDTATLHTDDMTFDKKVHLEDWEQRTYQIDLEVAHAGVQKEEVYVRDYIDRRFDLLDEQGECISAERLQQEDIDVGDGIARYDTEHQLVYVEWKIPKEHAWNQDIWRRQIHVQAKDSFIGGNDIPTNDAMSGVTVADTLYPFEQPHVNVRLALQLLDASDVYFRGEKADSLENVQSGMFTNPFTMGEDGNAIQEGDIVLHWYESAQALAENQPMIAEDVAAKKEAHTGTYYLQAEYLPLTAVNDMDACTQNSDGHIAANITVFGNHNRTYAIYTVQVVTGALQIRKTIDRTFGNIGIICSNQTHIFQIAQYEVVTDETGEEYPGECVAVFYVPISFDANGDITEGTEIVRNLSKGFYTVTEEETWTPEYSNKNTFGEYNIQDNDMSNDKENREGTLLFIGKRMQSQDTHIHFYGLDTDCFGEYAAGTCAQVQFYNRKIKSTEGILDSASAYRIFSSGN